MKTTEAYIPRLAAVREVREFISDWDDPEKQNYLIRRPRAMRGKLNEWRAMPSGNFSQERVLRGPLVLQLI